MGWLVHRAYLRGAVALAADLSSYGTSAQWKGIYYRGEKIGFSVGQVVPDPDGYELQEDGRIQMNLLGVTTSVRLKSTARVDRGFALRSFAFTLDPGSRPTEVRGVLDGKRLTLTITTPSGTRSETRLLNEPPALALNLPRRLAALGLAKGKRLEVLVFDPATMSNAPMQIEILDRDLLTVGDRPVPAFRVESRFSGIVARSWITDVGEVVKEESPTGLLVIRETAERAQALAVSAASQADMLEAAAIVPSPPNKRIDDPALVQRLRLRLTGAETFSAADLNGAGQTVKGDLFDLIDTRTLPATPMDRQAQDFVAAEPLIESDSPEIIAEARRAIGDARLPRAQAERLVRHVNAIVDKRPTVSIPSALEVLHTKVGDCNEHTALYVALARSLGLPARVAVGLVCLRGAFYYHAWAEVYLAERDRGLWLPVDPTLNQFPADATHLRLARGGLARQAAILGILGRARIEILEIETQEGAVPVLVGRNTTRPPALDIPLPHAGTGRRCWSSPPR
jgi:transglutaminase-like putative cysteine protease